MKDITLYVYAEPVPIKMRASMPGFRTRRLLYPDFQILKEKKITKEARMN
jgi:hypothetical protein